MIQIVADISSAWMVADLGIQRDVQVVGRRIVGRLVTPAGTCEDFVEILKMSSSLIE